MATIKSFFGIDVDTDEVRTPSHFYRLMHPELYSDSHVEREKMDKEQFKFILANLSTDMRQDAFEELTRRCVIKLITPNIIPQTGPTGGGDAKADLITYPVAADISALWALPDGGSNNNEVWTFAISTKKEWSSKMDSDVKKIIEHYPNCNRIYFCTNQPVSSRNRDQKQQKYKKEEWGSKDTYILDLNWYLQAVYDQGCYNDAIESLGLMESLKEIVVKGPLDTQREERLNEIERGLPQMQSEGLNDQYAADLLEAAKLARGLGRSELEVDGRFCTALNAARQYGFPQQEYECIYQKAWTVFYWFDNPDKALIGYNELRKLLDEEITVTRIGKIINLYRSLTSASEKGLMKQTFDHEQERQFFEKLCKELEDNPRKPACSLFLRICLSEDNLIKILLEKDIDSIDRNERVEKTIELLGKDIREATRFVDINFESQAEVLINLGQLIGINQKFDELIDDIVKIQSERSQDISAAEIQYKRGYQHLINENYEDAVKYLSRSNVLFHQENTMTQMVQTSGFLGKAYSELDLLYCSKVYYCKALGMLFKAIGDEGRTDHLMVVILRELCFVELRLGQLASFLEWLTLMDGIVATIPGYLDEDFLKDRGMLDAMLGARIYETQLDDKAYSILPGILGRHQLDFSKNVLLMRMGLHEDVSEEYRFLLDSEDTTKTYILRMAEDVKFLFPLTLNVQKKAHLQTLAHGCTFNVDYTGYTYCQTYSEMFLALMEMLIAGQAKKVFPSTPVISFEMRCVTEGVTRIEQGNSSKNYRVTINKNSFANQNNIWETLIGMFSHVVSGSILISDLESFLRERQEDDYFVQRMSLLAGYPNDVSNFFFNSRKCYLDLFSRKEDRHYKFKVETSAKESNKSNKQSDAIVTSLIDVKLWNEAKWKGCGYLLAHDYSEPGILVLMYENIVPAIKIFEQWEKDFDDHKLNLRIVFISGINKKHPQWYKVLLTPDVKQILSQEQKPQERYVISSSRFHLMNAATDENIKMLRKLYTKWGYIGISASMIVNGQMSFDKDKRYSKVIPVRNVDFIEAWSIKENDVESIAILAGDDVIIPIGKENSAPVLEVIAKKKSYGQEYK